MNFKIENFNLTFEAKGLKPLFQFMSLETYMPNESVHSMKENMASSYISKKALSWMKEEGIIFYSQENLTQIEDTERIIKTAYDKNNKIKDVQDIILEEVKSCFKIFRDLCTVYKYFDNGYLDGAYEAAKTSTQAAINAEKIGVYKNTSREDINRIFFEHHELWDNTLSKISTKFGLDRDELEWYMESEIYELFWGKVIRESTLSDRKKSFFFYRDDNAKCVFYFGDEALDFINAFTGAHSEGSAVSLIHGKVANRSREIIKSKVFNISSDYSNLVGLSKEMESMDKGDVLVSQTTAPELMPAIQKASAIVTDIGGMLSHAAIVSRELNIPCIIATGNASKILKTGDLVEVDADNGTIRIIK